jgi:hypothetical protein
MVAPRDVAHLIWKITDVKKLPIVSVIEAIGDPLTTPDDEFVV